MDKRFPFQFNREDGEVDVPGDVASVPAECVPGCGGDCPCDEDPVNEPDIYFDRSICACGMMHYFTQDGRQVDACWDGAPPITAGIRTFSTGATRDLEDDKLDYEGYFSPLVLKARAEYMQRHSVAGGQHRASDNWQKGIPLDAYIKSGFRHFMDWWSQHRGGAVNEVGLEDAICALMFNCEGYLHELLRGQESNPRS